MEINLENLEEKQVKESEVKEVKPVIDKQGRVYATGKRKTSIARVWLKAGKGKIIVNKKVANDYFPKGSASAILDIPFKTTDTLKKYDVVCTVKGGGISGQVDAIKHGVSKALNLLNPEAYRVLLRKSGLLTRDSRVVERKKYGRKKARKSFQFSKR